VIDFTGFSFCIQNGHFVENRMNTGLVGRREWLIHNVIHSSCGYPEKMNEIRGLEPEEAIRLLLKGKCS
jgi:hypothetical protein